METNPLSKLIELDKMLYFLELRGKTLRRPLKAMIERQQERLSFLLSIENVENDPELDPKTITERIENYSGLINYFSESLSNYDKSLEIKKIDYQKIRMNEILASNNNPATLYFSDHEYGIKKIISSMENLVKVQSRNISRLEEIIEAEFEAIIGVSPNLFLLK